VVWEVSSQSLVSSESTNLSSPCTSISWSPSDNALVYACANGFTTTTTHTNTNNTHNTAIHNIQQHTTEHNTTHAHTFPPGQLSLWLKPVPDALPDPFTVSVAAPAADKASEGEAQQQPLTGKRKVVFFWRCERVVCMCMSVVLFWLCVCVCVCVCVLCVICDVQLCQFFSGGR